MRLILAFVLCVAVAPANDLSWVGGAGGVVTRDSSGRVVEVDLRSSWVTDSDLREIAALPALRKLDLSLTRVTDLGMKELRSAAGIEELNLYYAELITDEGMAAVRGWKRLRSLNLRGTKITDNTLEHLAGIPTLESLDIGYAQVTDSGLDNLARLTGLKRVTIGGNKMTDTGLQFLRQIGGLTYLDIGGSQRTDSGLWSLSLTDAGVDSIAVLPELRELRMRGAGISARGLEKLRSLSRLELLDLQGCKRVNAPAAPVLSAMKQLKVLDVTGTGLTPEAVAEIRAALPECVIRFER